MTIRYSVVYARFGGDGFVHRSREDVHVVRVDDARERSLLVPDEVRGRIAGDLLDRLADEVHRPVGVQLAAEDDARHIRDERAELLLTLHHRFLGVLALGDVEEEALHVLRRAVLVVHEEREVLDPDDASVTRDAAVLGAQRLAGLADRRELVEDAVEVVRMDDPLDEVRIVSPEIGRISEHGLDLRAHVDVRGPDVETADVHGERQLLEEGLVAGFRLAQVELGFLAQA